MRLRQLDASTFVSGQIAPDDIPALAAEGVTIIVNNRPDGEEAGQPRGAEIEAAARAAGLDYRFIPVESGLSPDQMEAMAEALDGAAGKLLAFCRSGTRSAWLWALARSRLGIDADDLIAGAAAAGYDLTALRPFLRA